MCRNLIESKKQCYTFEILMGHHNAQLKKKDIEEEFDK